MTEKELCANVSPNIRGQAETLAKAVFALQAKIEANISIYENMPMAQMLTTTQGEKALKSNPALSEFRATVRDYAASLSNLQKILGEKSEDADISSLDTIRAKLKVVK